MRRLIPISKHVGIVLKAGLTYYAWTIGIAEISVLAGKERHFFEAGAGYAGKEIFGYYGRIGYNHMGKKGLLLKGGLHIVNNVPVFPTFGIGYSF